MEVSLNAGRLARCEEVLVDLCRHEHGTSLEGRLWLEHWRPESARRDKIRQFIILWLDGRPLYVAKVPISREDHKVRREFAVLERLGGIGGEVPEPLGSVEGGFVMRYLMTHNLPDVLAAAGEPERLALVERAVDRIADFHRRGLAPAGGAAPEEVAVACISDWRCAGERTVSAVERAQVGAMHGDLGPWNMRYDEPTGRLGLLDWEDFRELGLPALDLLNFLITLVIIVHSGFREMGFVHLYDVAFRRPGPFALLFSAGLGRYCRAMSVEAEDVLALLPLYYQSMLDRLRRDGRSTEGFFYGPFQSLHSFEEIAWLARLATRGDAA